LFHVTALVREHHGHHDAVRAGTSSTARTVQVRLVLRRRVDMHHQTDVINVDAPCGDVGGHENPGPSIAERGQVAGPSCLGEIAVQLHGGDTASGELGSEFLGAVLRSREQQRPTLTGSQFPDHRSLVTR
jgi:hypothetical protein